jgi:hypothetical protein
MAVAVFKRHALIAPSSVTNTNFAAPDVPPVMGVGGVVE